MKTYYNEFDKGKAAWLRELMKRGAITSGDVDERSICDVSADDLRGYRRLHFFAGIGLWDRALIEAGWSEDREIWTASCPCQPFSSAGRRKGKADERHLWPVLARLIVARRPECIIGEQVASGDGLSWFDDVLADLGDCGYTIGASITPACGYGAPHRRERLYWVAFAPDEQHERFGRTWGRRNGSEDYGDTLRAVGDSNEAGSQGLRQRWDGADQCAVGAAGVAGDAVELTAGDGRQQGGAESSGRGAASGCGADGVEHAEQIGRRGRRGSDADREAGERRQDHVRPAERGPVNGYWRDAAWIWCRDEKYRAVECTPLSVADGNTGDLGRFRIGDTETYITHPLQEKGKARVLRLRGAGDAIVLPQAVEWVRAVMEVTQEAECRS